MEKTEEKLYYYTVNSMWGGVNVYVSNGDSHPCGYLSLAYDWINENYPNAVQVTFEEYQEKVKKNATKTN